MANTPQSRREKGKRLERQWAKMLRESNLDKTAVRSPMSGAMETIKADILTKLPFSFEVKNQEKWNIHDFMDQAERGAKQHEMPVVVASRNRQAVPYVVMQAHDWIWLCQLAKESGQLVSQYGFSKKKQTT